MKVGDKVRVIGLPHLDGLPEESKKLFKACVGGVFEITDERQIPGLSKEFEFSGTRRWTRSTMSSSRSGSR